MEPRGRRRFTEYVNCRWLCGLALVLVLSAPASAKMMGPMEIEITGPGIDGAITITNDEVPGMRPETADLLAIGLFGRYSSTFRPPLGRLGPEYRLTYRIDGIFEEGEVAVFKQRLYPFATEGAVVATERQVFQYGDRGRYYEVEGGFQPYPRKLIRLLRGLGFPHAPPDPEVPIAVGLAGSEPAVPAPEAPSLRPGGLVALVSTPILLAALVFLHRRKTQAA